ncbi:high affinity methionine permease [Fusarium agapanthi]|uniref:High affinity methionine permease n=1 Tax=Fusarium agapanthi TaxID=1803897 RepID=A0A9P5EG05_9HYPO|nr:high affinity methionine permease [Fusarium agapanthi]
MYSDNGSKTKSCFSLLATVKLIAENATKCRAELLQYQVLRLKDEHLDLDNRIRDLAAEILKLQADNKDITSHANYAKEMGEKKKKIVRDILRKARKDPDRLADVEPYIKKFMANTGEAMGVMLMYHCEQKAQSTENLPPTPATEVGGDSDNDEPLDPPNSSPPSPHPTLRIPPTSKRTPPDAEGHSSPKRRAHRREIRTAEIDGFPGHKLTETPSGSGEWYIFRCEGHGLSFDGRARPAQAAARHAITHGLPPNRASAIEAFGIKIVGCDGTIAKAHNDQVVLQVKRKAELQVNKGADDKAYRPRHDQGTDAEMASLLGDINSSHPRHIPIRQAAATRKRTIFTRELDDTEKPAEITAKTIHWIKWPDDGICYPAYVLPWESLSRFRSKYFVPVDRGLLESIDELPACYDKGHGIAGVWAEGYKDGQQKMSERVYPVIFFTLGKRFPWECETAWAAEEDFRVFDGDKEDPQSKALVDHWRARENRQTPDDDLIRMKLMSPPGHQGSSTSLSSVRESSLEMSPENGNIDDEPDQNFMGSTECLGSGRGSRRAELPDSDDDRDDIGDALVRGAMESESRHTSAYLSQHMPHRKDTETHRRRCSMSMPPDEGTPPCRPNSDDEESLGESVSQYQMDNSPLEGPSLQRVETTECEEDIIQFDEASTSRRVSSSEQRLRQAMASAARQTNAAWRDTFREHSEEVDELLSDPSLLRDGNLAFTRVQGGNDAKASYQEAIGAPVETNSPLGYHVGWLTVIFLNVNQMIGTGIFSTPGSILNSTESIGLALIYWFIGFIMAIAGFCVYLEFASYFPSRSGTEVVYLERAYPRPKHFFPIAYAVQSVVLSFSSSNAIGVIAHNKYSLWAVNVLGFFKIITLIFISITGFVILGGNVSRIPDPNANFRNAFEGTTKYGNDLSTALVNIVFSYTGYANAFNVVNEVKRPIPTIKKYGFISVLLVAVLYMLCNVAYFSAVPKKEFAESNEIAPSVFFTSIFGTSGAVTALNVPFGTPIGPYLLKWAMTFIMIVAPPAGDAFQFVVSLKTYPQGLFFLAMSVGLYIVRRHNKRVGRGPPEFKAWDVAAIFFILIQIFIIVMPWYPPKGGLYAGDVSFWYATYCVVGIAIMILCGVYYVFWIHIIPRWKGYAIRPEVLEVDTNGANTHRLVRVPLVEIEKWDAGHDEAGNLRHRHVGGGPVQTGEVLDHKEI